MEALNYDLMTGKVQGDFTLVDAEQLWRVFFSSLNGRVTFDKWINPKEIKVISWIMAQPYRKCYFSKPNTDVIMDAIDNLSRSELTRIKKRLISMKLVEEVLEDGAVRTYPTQPLLKLKGYVEKHGRVSFSFNMELNEKT